MIIGNQSPVQIGILKKDPLIVMIVSQSHVHEPVSALSVLLVAVVTLVRFQLEVNSGDVSGQRGMPTVSLVAVFALDGLLGVDPAGSWVTAVSVVTG